MLIRYPRTLLQTVHHTCNTAEEKSTDANDPVHVLAKQLCGEKSSNHVRPPDSDVALCEHTVFDHFTMKLSVTYGGESRRTNCANASLFGQWSLPSLQAS